MKENPFLKTIVVKIGTKALTNNEGGPDLSVLKALVHQIFVLKAVGHRVALVSSGAVGLGRKEAQRPDGALSTVDKQVAASVGQSALMRIYAELFAVVGLKVGQALLEREHFPANGRAARKAMVDYFEDVLRAPSCRHIVPIVNENDVTATEELGFSDNDELASLLARQVKADKLIILTNIDGVYTTNPKDPMATIVPFINIADQTRVQVDTNGKSEEGRGGMESKCASIYKFLRALPNSQAFVANAREEDVLFGIMLGHAVGTRFVNKLEEGIPRRPNASTPQTGGVGESIPQPC